MIAIPGNVRVWLATGHTDMRRGFPSLARLVQESLKRDPVGFPAPFIISAERTVPAWPIRAGAPISGDNANPQQIPEKTPPLDQRR